MANKEIIHVRLPEWLLMALDQEAESERRTRSNMLYSILAVRYQKISKTHHRLPKGQQ